MGFTNWVAGLFVDEPRQIYECRECGTSLAPEADECPYCGPTDVVRHDLSE